MSLGRLMVSAAGSGHGKSVVTMGILEAMKERGISLQSFKCGPDYIDPGFHERVLGIPCRNLDTYLMGETEVLEEVSAADEAGNLCVAEGAMGLMDGLGGTAMHSAYSIARLCEMNILVVLDASRTERDCTRQLEALLKQDSGKLIQGVLINRCPAGEYDSLAKRLAAFYPVQVCGFLPPMEEAVFASRHLGLVGAAEAKDFANRVHNIARALEKSGCVDKVLSIVRHGEKFRDTAPENRMKPEEKSFAPSYLDGMDGHRRPGAEVCCRIAVARDEAFSFLYPRSLENLERAGAELVFFSPLKDSHLPRDVQGLYLPGGYPELYASALEQNASMRKSVKAALSGSLPTVAECGGFLYLGEKLCAQDGTAFEMAGFFPGSASRQKKLVRFGYLEIFQDRGDSLLLSEGESMTAHEFHYWESTANGEDMLALKRSKDRTWRFGYASPDLYAGFPHIYLDHMKAERFVAACEKWKRKGNYEPG